MNLKHEMFWNDNKKTDSKKDEKWTLNMKCFEILIPILIDLFHLNEP